MVDTKAHKVTEFPKQYGNVIASRPAHSLNDKAVQLRRGARAESMFSGGAALTGGHGHVGYVWAVQGGQAVVDFGATPGGHPLRVVANVAELDVEADGTPHA